ncbi:aldo/keto reductase [Klenkia taihuensis]|uniref:D-threo-aldose 1-dehydrogenase n=1 Tax=Klenkia taihuensis TaxID=1225127 RepID=A0A1I1U6Y4_9ACTN|nr:aldo/keto reductase [Klenkia taihuensis]GHE06954.1 oxidoreductase [Klenkia taihuensis]SFD65328.1 D-threo-aldose 1-dehydrogenase [Klenkia taihuensis]
MRLRELTQHLAVTELGLGTAGLGNLYRSISDEQARRTVDTAWDGGVRLFDTAPHYGLGLAERRLGDALADRARDEFVVSTKVGRLLVERRPPLPRDTEMFDVPGDLTRVWDATPDGVRRSLESSLDRLGLDHVDIALLHDPDVSGEPDALEKGVAALLALRDEGLVRAVGVGSNDEPTVATAFRRYPIDVAMLAGRRTLLRPEGGRAAFEAAAGRPVLLAGVFASGLLATPRPPTGARVDYRPASQDEHSAALHLAAELAAVGSTLPAAAIAHALAVPSVGSVVLGPSSPQEVEQVLHHHLSGCPVQDWSTFLGARAGS